MLGHDSDADLGYVSQHSNPVDVARESFEVQRRLARRRLARSSRYSGASFKILRHRGGRDAAASTCSAASSTRAACYLMGEIGTEFERDWIYPLGTADARRAG